jgi:hypothetical protein
MAPFGLALFGDSGDTSLPDRIEPCAKGHDAAFEKFIDGALVNIYNEASVRSANGKALRASCKPLLGMSFTLKLSLPSFLMHRCLYGAIGLIFAAKNAFVIPPDSWIGRRIAEITLSYIDHCMLYRSLR